MLCLTFPEPQLVISLVAAVCPVAPTKNDGWFGIVKQTENSLN